MKEVTERTFNVENVSLGYGEKTIVKDLTLEGQDYGDYRP